MYELNEIGKFPCDRKHIPNIYTNNFFSYEILIKKTLKILRSCDLEYTPFLNIFEKYIYNNVNDIERIGILLDDVRCRFINNYNLKHEVSYEVLELLELNWRWKDPCRLTDDGLQEGFNLIHGIFRDAKQNFNGHTNERRILIYILHVISDYDHKNRSICGGWWAKDDGEFKPAQIWLEEQCFSHEISMLYY